MSAKHIETMHVPSFNEQPAAHSTATAAAPHNTGLPSIMVSTRASVFERVALLVLWATTILGLLQVPLTSWPGSFANPCHLAALGGLCVCVALTVTSLVGERGIAIERWLLASFLAIMPVIYTASWFWWGSTANGDPGWLWIELLGVPVYVGFAVLGLRRSAVLLAAGIAGHGLIWDVWHSLQTTFMPHWYTHGCLSMDVGVAIYILARLPHLRAWGKYRSG